jgi:acetyl-CoA C-acetyltransferase
MKNREIFIVSAVRTPIGSLGGSLSKVRSTNLGALVIKNAIKRAGITNNLIDEVFMGNVLSANLGQAPARQAALFAGLPDTIPCTTINKVCASGMKSIIIGAQTILAGHNQVIVAGGMESMSNAPHYIAGMRTGLKLGHGQLTDGMIKDGLWDVYNDYHMGNAAELCAKAYNLSREEQDDYAIESYKRSANATEKGLFKAEIIPVEIPQRKGDTVVVDQDEEFLNVNFEKIPSLRPVFQKDGTVTAANSSTINDSAAAVVVMNGEKARELGIKPLVKILSHADTARAPEWFTIAPVKAIPLAIKRAGLKPGNIDYYEINEAFAAVSLAVLRELKLDQAKVNVNGGAISLGHPIGASGARIVVTLIHVLKQNNARYGVASLCNGGGGASALVIESI